MLYQKMIVPFSISLILSHAILSKLSIYNIERQKKRLSHDAIYNIHKLAYNLGNFVKVIMTYPDLVIVCGLEEVVQDLDLVLRVDSELPQLLSYDTTFQLVDFYVSPLLFHHTIFTKSPVFPALFLIMKENFRVLMNTSCNT